MIHQCLEPAWSSSKTKGHSLKLILTHACAKSSFILVTRRYSYLMEPLLHIDCGKHLSSMQHIQNSPEWLLADSQAKYSNSIQLLVVYNHALLRPVVPSSFIPTILDRAANADGVSVIHFAALSRCKASRWASSCCKPRRHTGPLFGKFAGSNSRVLVITRSGGSCAVIYE